MSKKLMSVTVKGNRGRYAFDFYADPKCLQAWLDDGLEIILIENTIPMWVVRYGLVRQWCFLQDVFNFKWPWHK